MKGPTDNVRIERERIRRKYRSVMLRLQHERDEAERSRLERRRAKLDKRFLALVPGEHVQQIDPDERCSRLLLQYELGIRSFTDDEDTETEATRDDG